MLSCEAGFMLSVELDSKYRVESVQRFSLMINDSVMEIWKACMSIQTLEICKITLGRN